MRIQHVEIGNFRKLQAVRVDFSERTTVLVGANNSGKTSAMEALRLFLVERGGFSITDFTLTHWRAIDAAAAAWEAAAPGSTLPALEWKEVVPFLDLWLIVPFSELHHVQQLLPTLDWDGSSIGVRLSYEPKDASALQHEYLTAKMAASHVVSAAGKTTPPEASARPFGLWPRTMTEFLERRLAISFEVRSYLLDPAQCKPPTDGVARPQPLPPKSQPIEGDPFKNILRVDEIRAQRALGGGQRPSPSRAESSSDRSSRRTSRLNFQLRTYYERHLDPFEEPEPKDLTALQALHDAQAAFGARLSTSFEPALKELASIGYPGITDPRLTITTRISAVDGLNHDSSVQYEVPTSLAGQAGAHCLPENSIGLGYQNLISIVFELMSFRDRRMRVGKAARTSSGEAAIIPPLHLVLIEEPEAHLHPQVQQVFINQAYAVLRKHEQLQDSTSLRTQLVVSTHSSHLAHEVEFSSLRYFRRLPAPDAAGAVPVSAVVNLSEVFGSGDETQRFVTRYLKATHCDLFFADGAVLIEGPAERTLVPHLVRERAEYEQLRRCYITWLEIGGSHAHRLRRLLEHLGLTTLIITDLDAAELSGTKRIKAPPRRNAGLLSRNATLKKWVPGTESLDALLDQPAEALEKRSPSGHGVRVAYQQPLQVPLKGAAVEALPNTFEDALLYENVDVFASLPGPGLIAAFRKALADAADLDQLAAAATSALDHAEKASFALELLYGDACDRLRVPRYIHHGLLWLTEELKRKSPELSQGPSRSAQ